MDLNEKLQTQSADDLYSNLKLMAAENAVDFYHFAPLLHRLIEARGGEINKQHLVEIQTLTKDSRLPEVFSSALRKALLSVKFKQNIKQKGALRELQDTLNMMPQASLYRDELLMQSLERATTAEEAEHILVQHSARLPFELTYDERTELLYSEVSRAVANLTPAQKRVWAEALFENKSIPLSSGYYPHNFKGPNGQTSILADQLSESQVKDFLDAKEDHLTNITPDSVRNLLPIHFETFPIEKKKEFLSQLLSGPKGLLNDPAATQKLVASIMTSVSSQNPDKPLLNFLLERYLYHAPPLEKVDIITDLLVEKSKPGGDLVSAFLVRRGGLVAKAVQAVASRPGLLKPGELKGLQDAFHRVPFAIPQDFFSLLHADLKKMLPQAEFEFKGIKGRGSTAVVVKALDKISGKELAVKVLRPDFVNSKAQQLETLRKVAEDLKASPEYSKSFPDLSQLMNEMRFLFEVEGDLKNEQKHMTKLEAQRANYFGKPRWKNSSFRMGSR